MGRLRASLDPFDMRHSVVCPSRELYVYDENNVTGLRRRGIKCAMHLGKLSADRQVYLLPNTFGDVINHVDLDQPTMSASAVISQIFVTTRHEGGLPYVRPFLPPPSVLVTSNVPTIRFSPCDMDFTR
jgi:hypothetical protein